MEGFEIKSVHGVFHCLVANGNTDDLLVSVSVSIVGGNIVRFQWLNVMNWGWGCLREAFEIFLWTPGVNFHMFQSSGMVFRVDGGKHPQYLHFCNYTDKRYNGRQWEN